MISLFSMILIIVFKKVNLLKILELFLSTNKYIIIKLSQLRKQRLESTRIE
jgi:hypothetical protein